MDRILHLIPAKVDGCAYHRIEIPMHNLQGYDLAQSTVLDGVADKDLQQMQLVVFHGSGSLLNAEGQIKRLKKMGLPYVVDVDDSWDLDDKHLLHEHYKKVAAKKLITIMKGASAVTTTISRLAYKIKKHNKNVVVVPNAIAMNEPQWQLNEASSNAYGWVGGVHHIEDIRLLVTAFKRFHKENIIDLALGGWSQFNEVYTLFEIWFSGNGVYDKYKRIEGRDVYNYGYIYDEMNVCLVPLVENKFNICKSPLKLIEAGFKNKACIVSNTAPYNDDFTSEHVLFVDNKYDWYEAVMKLHNEPNYILDLKGALNNYVREKFEIKNVNHLRSQLYHTLINGR